MSPATTFPDKPKVLSLGYPTYAGEEYMKDFEEKVDLHILKASDRKGTIAAVAAKVATDGPFDVLMVLMGYMGYMPFDAEFLSPLLPHLKLVVCASAGYNEFDIDWMTRNGIYFCNTRNAVSEATADMAIFLMLAVLRDTTRLEKCLRERIWRGGLAPTRDPSGLVLGIVGMGSIGKHIARKAAVFNMKVKYYNRTRLLPKDEQIYQATYTSSLEELLRSADVVSLSCPLNEKTAGMIGAKEFAQMKDGVFLINTSRGAVIDEDALIEALESGKVEKAGLDVFHNEPKINPYFINSDRCILQPHMGGLTDIAWKKAYQENMENIKALFATGRPIAPVNSI
ncbi:MAG: hypothetical protein M1834_007151 [Cirrosporium novae-zelandiae]|nr:MAG: hypothetical protein M1834_007151 [Cirrosporium novae-zelandiae]